MRKAISPNNVVPLLAIIKCNLFIYQTGLLYYFVKFNYYWYYD